jgi:hypothetical protein
MEALNFSLNAFSYLMLYLVKNKALDESFNSKTRHFSLLMLLRVSVSMLPEGGRFN